MAVEVRTEEIAALQRQLSHSNKMVLELQNSLSASEKAVNSLKNVVGRTSQVGMQSAFMENTSTGYICSEGIPLGVKHADRITAMALALSRFYYPS